MKKLRSRFAILLALTVCITSFSFGVFAEDEVPAAEAVTTEAEAPELAAQEIKAAEAGTVSIDDITVTPYSSFESVVLRWNKPAVKSTAADGTVTDLAATFAYYVNGVDVTGSVTAVDATTMQYVVTGLTPAVAKESGEQSFAVQAVGTYTDAEGTKNIASNTAVVSKAPVRTITYKVKIKAGATLASHGIVSGSGAKRQKYKVKTGQWLYVDRYGAGGKYIFTANDNIYYCNLTRTTKQTAIYTKAFDYTNEEAEFYVNAKGLTSKTGNLVWICTYCQRIYIFQGSKGNWQCIDSWECSTGKAKTPTPTGITGKKAIYKKIKKRHSIPYWSSFSDINSIHGKKGSWKFGKPQSNGCVRNPNEKAKYVYKNFKIGTTVFVY